jgi:tetratricopeptide (TPR) repeat protein
MKKKLLLYYTCLLKQKFYVRSQKKNAVKFPLAFIERAKIYESLGKYNLALKDINSAIKCINSSVEYFLNTDRWLFTCLTIRGRIHEKNNQFVCTLKDYSRVNTLLATNRVTNKLKCKIFQKDVLKW